MLFANCFAQRPQSSQRKKYDIINCALLNLKRPKLIQYFLCITFGSGSFKFIHFFLLSYPITEMKEVEICKSTGTSG